MLVLIFNHISGSLKRNNLLTDHPSGFIPKCSTSNRLLHICHKMYRGLDNVDEILSTFLDFSKAFDRVWHEWPLFKLRRMEINGHHLNWLSSHLYGRKQRMVICGGYSFCLELQAGVPQGSDLGPLLFFIHINDIVNNIENDVSGYVSKTNVLPFSIERWGLRSTSPLTSVEIFWSYTIL